MFDLSNYNLAFTVPIGCKRSGEFNAFGEKVGAKILFLFFLLLLESFVLAGFHVTEIYSCALNIFLRACARVTLPLFQYLRLLYLKILNIPTISVFTATYVSSSAYSIDTWFHLLSSILASLINTSQVFHLGLLIINPSFISHASLMSYVSVLQHCIPPDWSVTHHYYSATYYMDAVDASRVFILVSAPTSTTTLPPPACFNPNLPIPSFTSHTSGYKHNPTNVTTISLQHSCRNVTVNEIDSKPRVIATVVPPSGTTSHCAASDFILDPAFPIMEPTGSSHSSTFFGCRAGVCISCHNHSLIA